MIYNLRTGAQDRPGEAPNIIIKDLLGITTR